MFFMPQAQAKEEFAQWYSAKDQSSGKEQGHPEYCFFLNVLFGCGRGCGASNSLCSRNPVKCILKTIHIPWIHTLIFSGKPPLRRWAKSRKLAIKLQVIKGFSHPRNLHVLQMRICLLSAGLIGKRRRLAYNRDSFSKRKRHEETWKNLTQTHPQKKRTASASSPARPDIIATPRQSRWSGNVVWRLLKNWLGQGCHSALQQANSYSQWFVCRCVDLFDLL